eukprot:2281574-Amphidinium_carterae.1
MLKHIKEGTTILPGVQVKPWVAEVAEALMVFCFVDAPPEEAKADNNDKDDENKKKESSKVVHTGIAALDYLLKTFKENPPTSLCELRLLNIWRHKLKESDVELVIQWRDGISKKEPGKGGKKPL